VSGKGRLAMKLKYFNLGSVESGLWGIGIGLFIGCFLARHYAARGDTSYWIVYFVGFGFLFASFAVGAIRARNLRKK
jgi:hypothetical protein